MKTTRVRKEDTSHDWFIIDAADKPLGRIASAAARYLMGKNQVTYSPDVDNGNCVVVINASKIKMTGTKALYKKYYSHSMHIGNLKETSFKDMMEKHPERIVEKAVKGMIPKNKLGRRMMTRLRVYADDKHTQEAQKPRQITV